MDNLLDFIDVALDKLQAHGFHEEELHVVFVNLAVGGDTIELQATVILINFEKKLQEGDDANFLLKRSQFLQNVRETSDIFVMGMDGLLEFGNLTPSKSIQKNVKPLEV